MEVFYFNVHDYESSIMPRRFIFSDEAGCFNFARKTNVSRFFIICTVTMDSCGIGGALLDLRREMMWQKAPLNDYFHAEEDKQEVRNAVFDLLARYDLRVQATILEKSKAQPQTRPTKERFYQYGWHYHFKHSFSPVVTRQDDLLIVAASIGTKKGQAVFTNAVNDVVQQHIPKKQWSTFFCSSASDPCLQVADYCTWAIQRKWERDDTKSYDLTKDRITREYDLWQASKDHYY